MGIRKEDLVDTDVVDAVELLSSGATVYLAGAAVVSTTAGTKTIVSSISGTNGGFLSTDAPVGPGDFVVLAGTSGADGRYTIATVVDAQTVTVVETIATSTGGTATFYYPPGAKAVGFDPSGQSLTSATNVQDAITGIANSILASAFRGTSILDFGSPPASKSMVTVVVTGQTTIAATAAIIVVMYADDTTADHNAVEHSIVPIKLSAGSIVPGVGFTITAITEWDLTGTFKVRWSWSN